MQVKVLKQVSEIKLNFFQGLSLLIFEIKTCIRCYSSYFSLCLFSLTFHATSCQALVSISLNDMTFFFQKLLDIKFYYITNFLNQ